MTSAWPRPVCAPHFRFARGDGLKEVVIEPVVAAMMSDMIFDQFLGQVHERPDPGFDRERQSKVTHRFRLASARLQIIDRPPSPSRRLRR